MKDIKFKNLFNEDNKTILVGLLSILVVLWLLLYIIPGFLFSLFNTFLGNIILLIIIILVSSKDIKYGIIMGVIMIIVYRFSHLKEGFQWSKNSTDTFIKIQNSNNPYRIFDTNEIQKQASQEELDYFLENGMWPWSEEVQELYKDSVNNNPYVRLATGDAVNETRKIYNQSIISKILSWQTKEGQFLLNGIEIDNSSNQERDGLGSYAFDSGLLSRQTNGDSSVIKCGLNSNKDSILQQIKYMGDEGIMGSHMKDVKDLDYNNLESIIPGFKFVNGACNPCSGLYNSSDSSCSFTLDIPSKKNYQEK